MQDCPEPTRFLQRHYWNNLAVPMVNWQLRFDILGRHNEESKTNLANPGQSFKSFGEDKIAKYSGSLAYTVVFSLGPLLIVLIFICSIFFGQEATQNKIFQQTQDFIGKDGASQLQTIIKNASLSGKSNFAAIIGIITLLLGATAIFAEIQDSINTIWNLKSKTEKRNLEDNQKPLFVIFSGSEPWVPVISFAGDCNGC
jgi:uncharacterized BrkB/YihY/UPF0761 family membrane protein